MSHSPNHRAHFRNRTLAAFAIVLTGALGSGCGDQPAPKAATLTTPATSAPQPTETAAAPATEAPDSKTVKPKLPRASTTKGPLAGIAARLAAAGYSPKRQQPASGAKAEIVVDDVTIQVFVSAEEAEYDAEGVRDALADQKSQWQQSVEGEHVYFLFKDAGLTAADKTQFKRIVAIAEGRN